MRAAAGAVGARRAAVRAPGRGDGGADPAAAGDLFEPGGLWPLARAATPVLPGPTGRRGGGDLADAAGPGGGLGVAADLRGGASPGLDGAGLAVAVRRARRADPGRVRAAGTACARRRRHGSAGPGRKPGRGRGRTDRGRVRGGAPRLGWNRCSRCRRRSWWRRARVAGCSRRGRRWWRRCRSTRARVCDRAPRRVRVDGVTAVDRGSVEVSTDVEEEVAGGSGARDIALYRYSLIRAAG